MRSACGRVGLACLLATVSIGCGGGGGGGPILLNRLGSEYAAVFCRKAFTCCDAAELAGIGATMGDEATCRSMVSSGIDADIAADQSSLSAGRLVYHGDLARRCLDRLIALPCALWGADEELRRFPDCLGFYEGTVAPGATCTGGAECRDGFCDSASGVCVAAARLGESCTTGLCVSGLACLSDASGIPTVCGDPLPGGSACSYDDQCASAFCEFGPTGARVCGLPTFCNGV